MQIKNPQFLTPIEVKVSDESNVPYIPIPKKKKGKPKPIEISNTESIDKEEIENRDFDLRKAVIYDAILNRPHQ